MKRVEDDDDSRKALARFLSTKPSQAMLRMTSHRGVVEHAFQLIVSIKVTTHNLTTSDQGTNDIYTRSSDSHINQS